jgi:hypothetical protein
MKKIFFVFIVLPALSALFVASSLQTFAAAVYSKDAAVGKVSMLPTFKTQNSKLKTIYSSLQTPAINNVPHSKFKIQNSKLFILLPTFKIQNSKLKITSLALEDSLPDQNAFFPGGNEFLITYLLDNVTYPEAAITNKVQGLVKLSYYVEADSSVSGIVVIQDPGDGCAEAIKNLLSVLKYVPGIQNGVPLRQQLTLELPVYAIRKD